MNDTELSDFINDLVRACKLGDAQAQGVLGDWLEERGFPAVTSRLLVGSLQDGLQPRRYYDTVTLPAGYQSPGGVYELFAYPLGQNDYTGVQKTLAETNCYVGRRLPAGTPALRWSFFRAEVRPRGAILADVDRAALDDSTVLRFRSNGAVVAEAPLRVALDAGLAGVPVPVGMRVTDHDDFCGELCVPREFELHGSVRITVYLEGS